MATYFFNRTKRGISLSTEKTELTFASAEVNFKRNPQRVSFEQMLEADIDEVVYAHNEGMGSGNLKKDWVAFMENHDPFLVSQDIRNNGYSIIEYSSINVNP